MRIKTDYILPHDVIVIGNRKNCPFCGLKHRQLIFCSDEDYDQEGVVEQITVFNSGCSALYSFDLQTKGGYVATMPKDAAQVSYNERKNRDDEN